MLVTPKYLNKTHSHIQKFYYMDKKRNSNIHGKIQEGEWEGKTKAL